MFGYHIFLIYAVFGIDTIRTNGTLWNTGKRWIYYEQHFICCIKAIPMFFHGVAVYAIVCVAYFSSRAPMFDPLVVSAIEELWHHYTRIP